MEMVVQQLALLKLPGNVAMFHSIFPSAIRNAGMPKEKLLMGNFVMTVIKFQVMVAPIVISIPVMSVLEVQLPLWISGISSFIYQILKYKTLWKWKN